MVVTNKIASARHVLFVKHDRKEKDNVLNRLIAGFETPFSDELDDDFQDIVMGLFMPPERKWDDNTISKTHYVTDVLIPEAYVRFVMEVEQIPRHVAELTMHNWTMQVPNMLLQYRSRNKLPANKKRSKHEEGSSNVAGLSVEKPVENRRAKRAKK